MYIYTYIIIFQLSTFSPINNISKNCLFIFSYQSTEKDLVASHSVYVLSHFYFYTLYIDSRARPARSAYTQVILFGELMLFSLAN